MLRPRSAIAMPAVTRRAKPSGTRAARAPWSQRDRVTSSPCVRPRPPPPRAPRRRRRRSTFGPIQRPEGTNPSPPGGAAETDLTGCHHRGDPESVVAYRPDHPAVRRGYPPSPPPRSRNTPIAPHSSGSAASRSIHTRATVSFPTAVNPGLSRLNQFQRKMMPKNRPP